MNTTLGSDTAPLPELTLTEIREGLDALDNSLLPDDEVQQERARLQQLLATHS